MEVIRNRKLVRGNIKTKVKIKMESFFGCHSRLKINQCEREMVGAKVRTKIYRFNTKSVKLKMGETHTEYIFILVCQYFYDVNMYLKQ